MDSIKNCPKTYLPFLVEELTRGDVIFLDNKNYIILNLLNVENIYWMEILDIEDNEKKNQYFDIGTSFFVWAMDVVSYLMLQRVYGIKEGRLFYYANKLGDPSDMNISNFYSIFTIKNILNPESTTYNDGLRRRIPFIYYIQE